MLALRVIIGFILLGLLLAGPVLAGPADAPHPAGRKADFVDKWLINGGNLGGAGGAVLGQVIAGRLLPGPVGMVAGSFIGNLVGSLAGEWGDNKVGKSYNYAAFNRPALGEPGALVLKDAGPRERSLYMFDRWVVSGGAMAGMATHFGLNFLARRIPGAGYLAAPLFLVAANYVAGCIGDNIDGSIDLAKVGRRLDERAAQRKREQTADVDIPALSRHATPARGHDRDAAYRELVAESKEGTAGGVEAALKRYQQAAAAKRTDSRRASPGNAIESWHK